MPGFSESYRKQFLRKQKLYEKRMARLINKVAIQIAALANDPNAKYLSSWDISKSKKLSKKIDSIMLDFESGFTDLLENSASESWDLSNKKNDDIVDQYLAGLATIEGIDKKLASINKLYYSHNIEALKTFLETEKSFSKNIWKVSKQLRREMEIHLGFGILNGDSADTISRRIRYYLEEPEKLFRRVRDEKGNLALSKNAKEYNPGTGTYRSSYKNARRLTRTTINQAFLSADYERWQQLDFVLGIKIQVSAGHWQRMPKGDICDQVQGIYPKWFKFIGWHPQCLCTATPVLMSMEDFINQLQGKNIKAMQIQKVPSEFVKYISDNTEKINRLKNAPYYIRDNFKDGKLSEGLKFAS